VKVAFYGQKPWVFVVIFGRRIAVIMPIGYEIKSELEAELNCQDIPVDKTNTSDH